MAQERRARSAWQDLVQGAQRAPAQVAQTAARIRAAMPVLLRQILEAPGQTVESAMRRGQPVAQQLAGWWRDMSAVAARAPEVMTAGRTPWTTVTPPSMGAAMASLVRALAPEGPPPPPSSPPMRVSSPAAPRPAIQTATPSRPPTRTQRARTPRVIPSTGQPPWAPLAQPVSPTAPETTLPATGPSQLTAAAAPVPMLSPQALLAASGGADRGLLVRLLPVLIGAALAGRHGLGGLAAFGSGVLEGREREQARDREERAQALREATVALQAQEQAANQELRLLQEDRARQQALSTVVSQALTVTDRFAADPVAHTLAMDALDRRAVALGAPPGSITRAFPYTDARRLREARREVLQQIRDLQETFGTALFERPEGLAQHVVVQGQSYPLQDALRFLDLPVAAPARRRDEYLVVRGVAGARGPETQVIPVEALPPSGAVLPEYVPPRDPSASTLTTMTFDRDLALHGVPIRAGETWQVLVDRQTGAIRPLVPTETPGRTGPLREVTFAEDEVIDGVAVKANETWLVRDDPTRGGIRPVVKLRSSNPLLWYLSDPAAGGVVGDEDAEDLRRLEALREELRRLRGGGS